MFIEILETNFVTSIDALTYNKDDLNELLFENTIRITFEKAALRVCIQWGDTFLSSRVAKFLNKKTY